MRIQVLIDCEGDLQQKARYVLDTFLVTLGLSYSFVDEPGSSESDDLLVTYSMDSKILMGRKNVLCIAQSPQAQQYFLARTKYDVCNARWLRFDGRDIPILFWTKSAPPCIDLESAMESIWLEQKFVLEGDIVSSAFYFLSRWEESVIGQRDQWGRFRYEDSLYNELDCFSEPIVNSYLRIFESILRRISAANGVSLPSSPLWKGQHRFAVCLTHDVDWTTRWCLSRIWAEVMRCGGMVRKQRMVREALASGFRFLLSGLKTRNAYWNFRGLVEGERHYGFKSSFFFLADGKHLRDKGGYQLDDEQFIRLINFLQQQGCEIGIHGSFNSFANPHMLRSEIDKLSELAQPIWGIRQHYLRFDSQRSFQILEALGLRYDTTLAFAEREGYRSGFSFPFYPYNLTEDRPFKVLEIPLTLMDVTLRDYRGLDGEEGWNTFENILAQTAENMGCCTIIWHNSSFDDIESPGYGTIYWKALEWICEHGGWGASGREICQWWEERAIRLRPTPDFPKLEEPASHWAGRQS